MQIVSAIQTQCAKDVLLLMKVYQTKYVITLATIRNFTQHSIKRLRNVVMAKVFHTFSNSSFHFPLMKRTLLIIIGENCFIYHAAIEEEEYSSLEENYIKVNRKCRIYKLDS